MIYIGADHKGHRLKNIILDWIRISGMDCVDLGNKEYNKEDDYTDIAILLAEKVSSERARGILICGSGIGVCVAANKVKGIRAALVTNEKQSRLSREDDDANILCLSADTVSDEENLNIVEVFLQTTFSSEEKHIRRIKKIKDYEDKS